MLHWWHCQCRLRNIRRCSWIRIFPNWKDLCIGRFSSPWKLPPSIKILHFYKILLFLSAETPDLGGSPKTPKFSILGIFLLGRISVHPTKVQVHQKVPCKPSLPLHIPGSAIQGWHKTLLENATPTSPPPPVCHKKGGMYLFSNNKYSSDDSGGDLNYYNNYICSLEKEHKRETIANETSRRLQNNSPLHPQFPKLRRQERSTLFSVVFTSLAPTEWGYLHHFVAILKPCIHQMEPF